MERGEERRREVLIADGDSNQLAPGEGNMY